MKVFKYSGDVCRRHMEFMEFYKSNISWRRIIRNKVFKVKNHQCDIVFMITNVKSRNYTSFYQPIEVNIKVYGVVNREWFASSKTYLKLDDKIFDSKLYGTINVRDRNSIIRRNIRHMLSDYFILFGMDNVRLKIKKITVQPNLSI